MSNPYFRFKKFTVWHDRCAMKVGTDGVLLGSWAEVAGAGRILDIGTGTGLIALMLAQRNAEAVIDAIDIDPDACRQAGANVAASPFAGRIRIIPASLADFRPEGTPAYDLIVSNPPYFTDALKCPDNQRRIARHTDTLPLDDLLQTARKWLHPDGRLGLIWPADSQERLETAARDAGLHFIRLTAVHSRLGTPPKRLLAELGLKPVAATSAGSLTIEEKGRQYTGEFTRLVKDFYLYV